MRRVGDELEQPREGHTIRRATAEITAVHTVGSLRAEHGGPTRSIVALCAALRDARVRTTIVTLRAPGGKTDESSGVDTRFTRGSNGPLELFAQRAFRHQVEALLGEHATGGTLVHDHGIWLPTNHSAAIAARRGRVKRIVSPRGMLSRWALEFHKLKKAVAWRLFQRADLRSADLAHVTSDAEAEEVRALGFRLPIAIIPNGVTAPPAMPRTQRTPGTRKQALFLSRLHRKKGLLNLVDAWATTAGSEWCLTIAGPDDAGEGAAAQELARTRGVGEESLRFIGPVADRDKWALFSSSDLFILPSFSENFGIVVAEALASGVPVITTKATPWASVAGQRCGWWIDIGVSPLVAALREAFAASDDELLAMGSRGKLLIERDYAWPGVAAKMAETYRWLLHGGSNPAFVFDR